MAEWELRRLVHTGSVLYDRNFHDEGGAAVVYAGSEPRTLLVIVNGVSHTIPWPDTSHEAWAQGDRGGPLGVRLRWDAEWQWTLYCYMFSGDDRPHSEWEIQVG